MMSRNIRLRSELSGAKMCSNVTIMIDCLITRKPLNLDIYIILSLNKKQSIGY